MRFFPKQCWSILFGNFFEHFDTALFSCLSPFIAPLFFPTQDPLTALLYTYAMIPLSMLARPFGSLVFGYLGDIYGRKKALFFTLFSMGILSLFISLTPTYASIGILAPILFCIWRLLQNFFAAGEIMGGAVVLLENLDTNKKDLISSFYSASTIGGILLASFGVYLFSAHGWIEQGWRTLYLFGAITALFACLFRLHMKEEPTNPHNFSLLQMARMLYEQRKNLALLAMISGFFYANFSISMVLINGFIPLITPFTKAQMSALNTSLLVLDFAALPLFGYLSTKITKERLMMLAGISILALAIPLFTLIPYASLLGIILIRILLVILGVAFAAPFHAYVQDVVPKTHRYLIISFSYAIGSQLLGGTAPMITLWIYKHTHLISAAPLYWILLGAGAIGAISVLKMRMKEAPNG